MKTAELTHDMSFEEALREEGYARFWDSIQWLEVTNDEDLLPEKLMAVRKDLVVEKIKTLQLEQPEASLREAIMFILKDLPDSIPSDALLELTRFSIEQWESRPLHAPHLVQIRM